METNDIDKKRSYIHFSISNESFAIVVNRVLEILHLDQLTCVPNSSEYIMGILNFRGAIVPVVDLHKRFNFQKGATCDNMAIVVEVDHNDNRVLMGLCVEEVNDVIEFEYKDIRTVPDIGIKYNPEFLEGFIEMDGKFIMVLDVDRVLSVSELAEVKETTNTVISE
jgi:purine-binding chemotaxis protein CheW